MLFISSFMPLNYMELQTSRLSGYRVWRQHVIVRVLHVHAWFPQIHSLARPDRWSDYACSLSCSNNPHYTLRLSANNDISNLRDCLQQQETQQ